MSNLTLVVMAAGIGSRYGGLKQVQPIGPGGEAILDYSVHDARTAGFDKIVFVIRRDIEEDFRRILGHRIEAQMDTRYVFQELDNVPEGFTIPKQRVKPWGTAHAVLCCREEVQEPFAVINADDFYGSTSYRALADELVTANHRSSPHEYCLVGFVLEKTLSEHGYVSRGVCQVSDEGLLTRVRERTHIERRSSGVQYTEDGGESWHDLTRSSVVSMNMWGFGTSLFDELAEQFPRFLRSGLEDLKSEFFLPSVAMELLSKGKARVRVLPTSERWVGVTHREDLEMVRAHIAGLIEQGIYRSELWNDS
jgi:NDP-sugar pyrophosphorylase family protein